MISLANLLRYKFDSAINLLLSMNSIAKIVSEVQQHHTANNE